MTREQAEAVGRRALAAGFEPRNGMCYRRGKRHLEMPSRVIDAVCWIPPDDGDWWPDFRDATGATRGVLLEQVREAMQDPHAHTLWDAQNGWTVMSHVFQCLIGVHQDHEAGALVAVLEIAKKYSLAKSPTDAPS